MAKPKSIQVFGIVYAIISLIVMIYLSRFSFEELIIFEMEIPSFRVKFYSMALTLICSIIIFTVLGNAYDLSIMKSYQIKKPTKRYRQSFKDKDKSVGDDWGEIIKEAKNKEKEE